MIIIYNWFVNIVVVEGVICFRLYPKRDFVGTMTEKIIAEESVKHLVVSE